MNKNYKFSYIVVFNLPSNINCIIRPYKQILLLHALFTYAHPKCQSVRHLIAIKFLKVINVITWKFTRFKAHFVRLKLNKE